MTHFEHNHYFIELLQDLAPELSSGELVKMRVERARDFIAELRGWLETEHLSEEVSDLKVTALGRIMLTASQDVAERLSDMDHPEIAAISYSSQHAGATNVMSRTA
ncbi:MAG: hypothetical protein AB7G06_01565 [Bdellovibrionales bacterium]